MEFISCHTFVVLNALFLIQPCESANILVILPTPFRSHLNLLKSVIDVLATEHKVTFYSVNQLLYSNHQNVTERRITIDYFNGSQAQVFSEVLKQEPFCQVLYLFRYFAEHFEPLLSKNGLNALNNATEKYDLFITVQIWSEVLFQFSSILNVPLIQITPSVPLPWVMNAINNRYNLGYDASFFTYDELNSFIGRIQHFIKQLYVTVYYEWVYLPSLESLTKKYYPPGTQTINEASRNTKGLLVNYLSPMGYVRPATPNMLEIGGLHCRPPRSMSPDLEHFVSESGEHGFVYFSLGATVSDLVLSPEIKAAILNVLKKLSQRILWKMEEDIVDLPANIKISKWFPQQDILGHKKIKLFITQGGMLSMQEAAYHGVPVLVLPLILDQFTNGHIAEQKGYGKMLTLNNFHEYVFYKNIQELINDNRFREKAQLVSASIKDQPITTAEKLKHWINFIIRYRDSSPFQSVVKNLSYIQLMELDIIFTIFFVTSVLIISFAYISLHFCKIIRKCLPYQYNRKSKLS